MQSRRSHASLRLMVILVLGLLPCLDRSTADAAQTVRRVLLLYPYSNIFPAGVIAGEAAKKRLVERLSGSLEVYADFLDLGRFSGEAYEARLAHYIADKYRNRMPEIVVALGPQALQFVIKNRQQLEFRVPIVFCCTSRDRLGALNIPGDVTGIISEFDYTKTLTLAQRLQPNATHLAVVAGATEFDRQSVEILRRQFASFGTKYDTQYLVGLRYDELLASLRRLPRDTIVILLTMFADGAGRLFINAEPVKEISDASAAPVYSPYETYLGNGVLGGRMDSFQTIGHEAADVAADILTGANPSDLPPRTTTGSLDRIDWRQLKRWNISESSLPPDATVYFREYNVWERYRWQIVIIASIMLAQAAMVAWLLIEHRRRRLAEVGLRQRLMEVIHLNRTALTGALSSSVAHELNQPLAAIMSNAEAAAIYLKSDPPNIGRVEIILDNIRRDDQRASDIISHLRGLLKKKDEAELQEFDLNEVVRDTIQIVGPEAARKGVEIRARKETARLPVRGDRVHLQQVLLILAVNGIDAMQSCKSGHGNMAIMTALVDESAVEVSVADSGIGIPADMLNRVFEAFYTTKQQGTGLGLSIARTIVESYGGKIWAENQPRGGAMFRFTLPLSKAVGA